MAGEAGKGSSYRKVDGEKFRSNLDKIFGMSDFEKSLVRRAVMEEVPCLGESVDTINGTEYDCGYENATFPCEHCVVNGGACDPRTGQDIFTLEVWDS